MINAHDVPAIHAYPLPKESRQVGLPRRYIPPSMSKNNAEGHSPADEVVVGRCWAGEEHPVVAANHG